MKALITTLITGLLSVDASAQDEKNWYATAKFGASILGDQNLTFVGGGTAASDTARFDTGFAAGGALGYDFNNRWRLEGEFMYRTNDLETTNLSGIGNFSDGDYASTALAINGFYEFDFLGTEEVRAYAGAGLVFLTEVDIDFEDNGIERSFSTDDFGFQLMFGARYKIGNAWFLEAEARYFSASGIDLQGEENILGQVTADYDPVTISAGLGWRF